MEELDFLIEPMEIFRGLLKSRENGTVIGINSSRLGRLTYLTGVEDITVDNTGHVFVVFRPCDTSGYMFPVRTVSLDKINSVKPFSSRFQNIRIDKKSGVKENINPLIF